MLRQLIQGLENGPGVGFGFADVEFCFVMLEDGAGKKVACHVKEILHTIRKLKNAENLQERLQGWRDIRAARGLSGEYALAVRLNGKAYTEEEADMVAALFDR